MSESEFERLYQEFVRKGGGTYTFDGSSQTPAEFYDLTSLTDLSAEEIARLQAAQEQFNRQSALNTISSELSNNTFTNPFTSITQSGRNAYDTLANDPGVNLVSDLNAAINASSSKQDIIDYFVANGIDPSFLSIATLPDSANSMYDSVESHTDSQVSNLVQTLQDVTSLVNMSKQFGEQDTTCNAFNSLMGLLSGSFDGVFGFLEGLTKPVMDFISPFMSQISQITSLIQQGPEGLMGLISGVLDPIMSSFSSAMSSVGDLFSKATGFISDITNQITSEISGLLGLAANLTQMAQALSIASSSFDICQLAVLMRTGSSAFTSALQLFSTPLPSFAPDVPTISDPRANPLTVQNAFNTARQSTLTEPGVPQSPLTASAMLYNPMSAYLTAPLSKLMQPINDIFSTIQSASGQISMVKNILSDFDIGGSENGVTASDFAKTTSQPQMVKSKAFDTYTSKFMNDLLRRKTDLKNLRIEITNEIGRTDITYSVAVRGQAKSIIESLSVSEKSITATLDSHTRLLTYVTLDGKRVQELEDFSLNEFNTVISPSVTGLLSSTKRVYDSSYSWWDSVKIV